MNHEFLTPVDESVLTYNESLPEQAVGNRIKIHSNKMGFPDIENVHIAILGVPEFRTESDTVVEVGDFSLLRKELYKLFWGNWYADVVDLGNINPGAQLSDTYFALSDIITSLLKQRIIPVVLGGSHDLTYALYRAYDTMKQTVNLALVDRKFDIHAVNDLVTSNTYLNRIILEQPLNLFNCSVIGYQTYYNAQEEIDLIDKLYFEGYRLGVVANDLSIVEPVFRDTDLVSIDLSSVNAAALGNPPRALVNGFTAREVCGLSRYAGISDKVTSCGIFNIKNTIQSTQLIAQMIWYFIEGFNIRKKDYPFASARDYKKYTIPLDDMDICFFESNISGRWWIEISQIEGMDNKFKRHTLLPCTHNEYLEACKGIIPDRWWKAYKKMLV